MSASNPLQRLHELGQSFWWDTLSRRILQDGTLERMRDKDGMRGVTSNPAIFQQAIAKSDDYDGAVAPLAAKGLGKDEIFWELAVEDIQLACDQLRPVYEGSEGADGFVSLEVDPRLAHDTRGTLEQAKELWEKVGRPNLMVKIPATPAGVPAIHQALVEGLNINVTLLFSQRAHIDVMDAYLDAMDERLERGLDLAGVSSVASFFVSRVDSLVDSKLEDIGSDAALELRGQAGVANARLAYQNFLERFSGDRWDRLAAAGARVQRPLWASTSTKNPEYPDTLYVETLIGPHTVNTMPTATVEAWRDHGTPRANSVCEDLHGARGCMERLEAMGIGMDHMTDQLLAEGVDKFEQSYVQLLGAIAEKAGKLAARE